MGYWEAGFGGNSGGSFRIRVNADVVAQDENGNQSLVQYSAYVDRVSTAGGRIYNNYATYGHTNLGRYGNPQRGGFTYNTTGNGRVITMAQNEQRWYGHDGNGNGSDYFGADYNPDNSPYWTGGSTGGGMGFPSLYLWAAPNYIDFTSVTDTSFNFRVITNRVVDIIAVKLNGGDWMYFYGATTDRTMNFSGLRSDTVYGVYISLHRQSSGYWQEHGTWYTTTLAQNKFFDVGDF